MRPRARGADPMMRAIQDLTAGHKSAVLLRQRLFGDATYTDSCDDGEEVRRLLERIILSFNNSITGLDSYCGDLRHQAEEGMSSANKVGVEDTGESCKPSSLLAVRKGRRGCYKRRKGSESWTNVVPALMDDGQTWRKYGQKIILNAPFPRSYFRCTHKKDLGCLATKQVQQTQSDPPLYTVNYDGRHTCTNSLKSPSLIVDSSGPTLDSSTALLSFNSAESHLYQGCCSVVPSEYYDMEELLEFTSNASSDCSNLEFLQGGVDLDDYMKLEFE